MSHVLFLALLQTLTWLHYWQSSYSRMDVERAVLMGWSEMEADGQQKGGGQVLEGAGCGPRVGVGHCGAVAASQVQGQTPSFQPLPHLH